MSIINGTAGNDRLTGTSAADTIHGLAGNDNITGLGGGDQLFGDAGNDWLNGGAGEDRIDGGIGNDTAYGGDGNDRILLGAGNDYASGQAGNDKVDAGSGDDRVLLGAGNDWVDGGDGADSLIGGDGNDTVYGGAGGDTIEGGTGNDYISAQAGDDTADGGVGNDTIKLDGGNDVGRGGDGNDSLEGGTGNDRLYGGRGADRVDGGAGDDVIHGDRELAYRVDAVIDGRDLLLIRGDTLQWHHRDGAAVGRASGANEATVVTSTEDGEIRLGPVHWIPTWSAPPPDQIADEESSSVWTGLLPALPEDVLNGTVEVIQARHIIAVNDQPIYYNQYTLSVLFDDSAVAGADRYSAKISFTDIVGGDDTLLGGAGNDVILGGGGNDVITGGDGNDRIDGGNGSDTIDGGSGNDVINDGGDVRNETFHISADTIFGGAGNDTITTGIGPDTVHGGDGADTIICEPVSEYLGEGTAQLIYGDAGDDVIRVRGQYEGDGPSINLSASIYGGDGNDRISVNTDTFGPGPGMSGDGGVVDGGNGNDVLTTGGGFQYAPTLPGTMVGGAGDDVLFGTMSLVMGGTGNDVFGAEPGSCGPFDQVIGDFVHGSDRLALSNPGSAVWTGLDLLDSNGDHVVDGADEQAQIVTATVGGVTAPSLQLVLPSRDLGEEDPNAYTHITLFNVTSLVASDFVTSGGLPWA